LVTGTSDGVRISALQESEKAQWNDFLRTSNNGTLFHDLKFLDYHPPGRFHFEHLVARRGRRLVALVPGGIVTSEGESRFVSPLGASFGGLVTAAKLRFGEVSEVVTALQVFAADRRWSALELTTEPWIYQRFPFETIPFVLLRHGFRIARERLTFTIPLQGTAAGNRFERLFRATSANEVRVARRRGVCVLSGGSELLSAFLPLMEETYRRLTAEPTHTPSQLQDLLVRLPDRVRIFLAVLNDEAIAGALVFLLNDVTAYSFYHVMSQRHADANGNKVVFAEMIDRFAASGFRWLDLGPSASLDDSNDSVVFFKEGLGAVGQRRSTWIWRGDA
jgi:hypothetical protein